MRLGRNDPHAFGDDEGEPKNLDMGSPLTPWAEKRLFRGGKGSFAFPSVGFQKFSEWGIWGLRRLLENIRIDLFEAGNILLEPSPGVQGNLFLNLTDSFPRQIVLVP